MKNKNDFAACYDHIRQQPSLCKMLSARLTDTAAGQARARADRAKSGRFILPGTGGEPLFVGCPPRWGENPVGDEEFVWSLNRQEHWKDYILAYCAGGKKEYLEQMRLELLDWISTCPCPPLTEDPETARQVFSSTEKGTPWRSLESGIRMYASWNWAIPVLVQEGLLDEEGFATAAESVCRHAELLLKVPPLLWPKANHNHYIMENLGLLYAARMLWQLPKAKQWAQHANRELCRCVQAQLTEDGGQLEGSPSYHALCMTLFLRWFEAAQELGLSVPESCRELVSKGMDYLLYCTRPTGVTVPYGDSDPAEDAVLPALLAKKSLKSDRWLLVLAGLLGQERLKTLADAQVFDTEPPAALPDTDGKLLPRVNWQHTLSQAMLRTNWTRQGASVFFGCRIPCFNGHSHIEPASFDFTALGRALVVDPGRYTYMEGPMRRIIKSAEMHNLLTLDGCPPYTYATRWTFENEKDGCIYNVGSEANGSFAMAVHTSYFPTIHSRMILLFGSGFLLVWDRLDHAKGRRADLYFHLDFQDVQLRQEQNEACAKGEVSLLLKTMPGMELKKLEGFVSDKPDQKRPSVRLCCTDEKAPEGRADYLTLLVPFQGAEPRISELAAEGDRARFEKDGRVYEIFWDGETLHTAIF